MRVRDAREDPTSKESIMKWMRCMLGLTWLVKRQMTIFANASQEKIDPTRIFDSLFIRRTFADKILNGAVKKVHLFRWNVDMGKELREPAELSGRWSKCSIAQCYGHECMITLGVVTRQADVFVHVESDYIFEGKLASLNKLNEMLVRRNGG